MGSDRLLQETNYTVKAGEIEYFLSPVNWNVLADVEEAFDCSLLDIQKPLKKKQMSTMRTLLWIFVSNDERNPEVSKRDIAKCLKLSNVLEISGKIEALIKASVEE